MDKEAAQVPLKDTAAEVAAAERSEQAPGEARQSALQERARPQSEAARPQADPAAMAGESVAPVEAGLVRQIIGQLRRLLEESNVRRGELEKAAQAREKELEKARETLSRESEARNKAEEENGQLQAQIAETRRDLAGVKSQCDDLEADVRQRADDLAQLKDELRAEITLFEDSQKQVELLRQDAGLSQQARAENERLRQERAEALRNGEQAAAQLQKEAAERAAAQAEAQRLREELAQRRQAREENEKLRQKIAAALQAAEAPGEAQESRAERDSLRAGKVEKAGVKRPREIEPDGAGGEPPQEAAFESARAGDGAAGGAAESLFSLLRECKEKAASDLHLASERQPYLRVGGRLQRMEAREEMSAAQVQAVAAELMRGYDRAPLDSKGSLDGVVSAPDGTRFRFNISRAQNGLSVACRRMASQFKTLAELQLPETLNQLCMLKDGLVIIAGPAGAGKSTTLATLLDRINQTRRGHIITIEDPIEFVHQPASCLVNQRQVGIHASSFNDALIAALRQDPDVIMVGEMRDQDTIRTAVTAGETGHLVFTTVHAPDSIGAIDRLLSTFPPEDQDHVRRQLAGVLRAIVAQHLLPLETAAPGAASGGRLAAEPWNASKDRRAEPDRRASAEPPRGQVERRAGQDRRSAIREDRVPACEVLFVTPAIANLIAMSQLTQVYSFVESGSSRGMQTLDQDLARLCVAGKISESTALGITRRPKMLKDHIAHLARESKNGGA